MRITSAQQARSFIGKTVYWDDVGSRYIFLRQGVLEGVNGRTLLIDGDYKERGRLTKLRSTKEDGCDD